MHHNEALARRIVNEVETVTAERTVRWVTVQQIARRLSIHHSSATAAVRVAVDLGWLIAEGHLLIVSAERTAAGPWSAGVGSTRRADVHVSCTALEPVARLDWGGVDGIL